MFSPTFDKMTSHLAALLSAAPQNTNSRLVWFFTYVIILVAAKEPGGKYERLGSSLFLLLLPAAAQPPGNKGLSFPTFPKM